MKYIFQKILAILAKATLWRYRPMIVAITGSVGKTSTKEAIFTVLRTRYRVRRSEKNYNTEIGVPLTILGIPHCGRNIFKWLFVIMRSVMRVIIRAHEYPQVLVLEMAADRPGDIAYLTKLAPPFIGVITAIGEIPVHVEFFAGPRAVAEEKTKLIQTLPADGFAVLNYDDAILAAMQSRTSAKVIFCGFRDGAHVRIRNYELHVSRAEDVPGISFKLEYAGNSAGVKLSNTFGKQQASAASAAAAVGLALKMSMSEIASALLSYQSPPGRLKLLRGNKQTSILDDTYNASPASTLAALEVLEQFPASRRIAVLGDMLELGSWTEEAHRMIGRRVAQAADLFLAVGERMKFALDEVSRAGMKERRQPPESRVFWLATAREAGQKLEALLKAGDVVLVKGSQGLRMERVVEEVLAEPEKAGLLLVRQDKWWLNRS